MSPSQLREPAPASALIFSSLPRAESMFPPVLDSPGQARTFIAETCHAWGLDGSVDVACLIVSELICNTVVHAHTDAAVTLEHRGAYLMIQVRDRDPHLPRLPAAPAATAVGGRGLLLIAALSSDWGIEPQPDGKIIWAALPAVAHR
jgi:Histidine kinase-like ATPase domain